jgi:hypothetical protein
MGSDLVYSILSPEWNADKTRVDRFVIDCSRTVPWNRFVQVRSMEAGSMEEAGSGHEDSSHNILTLDALQVLSRSGNLGCQCPCGYGRYVSLHTYIHACEEMTMLGG